MRGIIFTIHRVNHNPDFQDLICMRIKNNFRQDRGPCQPATKQDLFLGGWS